MNSVCMATYNGSLYIEIQLSTILRQLDLTDELILVDDCSTDSTIELVRSFDDKRIKIFQNKNNIGVIKTFERAIQLAVGDIIFLSDQDDFWHSQKVEKFMCNFEEYSNTVLMLSDARVVDSHGQVILESFYRERGGFNPSVLSNIVKNKYLGCTMAFRGAIKDNILPFPADIPMHDMWIGLLCKIYGGVRYIDCQLIDYRRHKNNASPGTRRDLIQIVIWRWRLVKNLCLRVVALTVKYLKLTS